ncbi:hypothetical protein ROHU_003788 [Labeo rohita]|uniref:Uncharacterized protein n=1 Tax=Labeo rohita TaxID=84645 RepID=A0A498NU30_LABRO|nr:hypothetical protein ROHU_003788 [Labeo rohita]
MSTGFNNVSDSTPNSSQVQNPSNKTESRPDWLLYSVPALAFLIGIVLFTFICKTQRRRNNETQSYENVEAAIYNNQDKVTYYVSADEDYLNPDAFVEEEMPGPDHNTLQLPSNLTDTDGESYENMEGCLYAQPRKQTQQLASEDEDYINPDEDRKQDLALDQTDTALTTMMFLCEI